MAWYQKLITLSPRKTCFHLVDDIVLIPNISILTIPVEKAKKSCDAV
jgi:hypothetical protein